MKRYLMWCICLTVLDGVAQTLEAVGVVHAVTGPTRLAISGIVNFVWAGLGVYLVTRGIE